MEVKRIHPETLKRIERFQRDEMTGSVLYAKIARRQKDENNKRAFEEISKAERSHYEIWKGYTKREIAPNGFRVGLFLVMSRVLGITFTLKLFESLKKPAYAIWKRSNRSFRKCAP